jgi:hypothetical protein
MVLEERKNILHQPQKICGFWTDKKQSILKSFPKSFRRKCKGGIGIRPESGHSLVYVLFLMVLLSTTLLILFKLWAFRAKLIQQKGDYLTTKYAVESAFYEILTQLSYDKTQYQAILNRQGVSIIDSLSRVQKSVSAFGGYLYVDVRSDRKHQSFYLEALVGQRLTSQFNYGVILSPDQPALVLASGTRIWGNVLTGIKGVKAGRIENTFFKGKPAIDGTVIASSEDRKPQIDYLAITQLFRFFDDNLILTDLMVFEAYLHNHSQNSQNKNPKFLPIVSISNEQINRPDLQLTGPVIFLAREPLVLKTPVMIHQRVIILSDQKIIINSGVDIREAIFYSPEKISVLQGAYLELQLYSKTGIYIGENATLDYPSLLMVYSPQDTGSIVISNESEVSGSLFYLSDSDYPSPGKKRGQLIVTERGRVNGLLYSSDFTILNGKVYGIVITDQFYFYRSPIVYLNWISGATVERRALTDEFILPLFFKQHSPELSPVGFR